MDAGDSAQGAAAVEVAVEQPVPSFVHGALAGVSAAAVLAHVWLAIQLAPLSDMYKEMGTLPPSIRAAAFVLRASWRWGVPAVGAVALAVLLARRPRALAWYIALAAALLVTAVATWHFAHAPIYELAGTISD
jgi:hypothetical protein